MTTREEEEKKQDVFLFDGDFFFLSSFFVRFLYNIQTKHWYEKKEKEKQNEQKAILLHGTTCFRFAEIHRRSFWMNGFGWWR